MNNKTDNAFFFDKVLLRSEHLPEKKFIRILDAYAGKGSIWQSVVATRPDVTIEVYPIEEEAGK